MKDRRLFQVIAPLLLGGLYLLNGCGGKAAFQERQLIGLSVQPGNSGVLQGATIPFTATASFDQAPLTETNFPAHWVSSESTLATIDGNGVATCLEIGGPITITASATGKNGTVSATADLTCESPVTEVTFDPASLAFVCIPEPIGHCTCDPQRTTTLTNIGTSTLSVTNITVAGAFHLIATTCGQNVGPGDACDIAVGWSRVQARGAISITDNAIGSPQQVGLSGQLLCRP